MNRRSMLLSSALIAAIAASVWSITTPEGDSMNTETRHPPSPITLAQESTREPQHASQPASPTEGSDSAVSGAVVAGHERQVSPARDDIFAAYSWEPPKAVVAAIKEPPRAPPVPFVYAGRLQSDGPSAYILAEGARMHVLVVGEQIGDFKLQQVSSAALVFLHVPTNLPATLSIAQ